MSQVHTDGRSPEPSVVEQVQERVQEGASQAGSAVRGALTGQIDGGSTQVGRQLREVAEALRRTGRGLESEGSETPARIVGGLSARAERLGSYLAESSSDRLL